MVWFRLKRSILFGVNLDKMCIYFLNLYIIFFYFDKQLLKSKKNPFTLDERIVY